MVKIFAAALLAATAGCTTLTAPDEAKSLRSSTSDLTSALIDADSSFDQAGVAYLRERAAIDAANGRAVDWKTDCDSIPAEVDDALPGAVGTVYRAADADAVYARLRQTRTCGFATDDGASGRSRLRTSEAGRGVRATLGARDLPGAARSLDAYVAALSDVATGETAAKTDAARAKLFSAGKDFAMAVKMPSASGAVLGVIETLAGSVVSARRNATTREFLNRIDPYIPTMMEQVGMAGRLATAGALRDRARTASDIADHANRVLNRSDMVQSRKRARFGTAARKAMFDDLAARIDVQNDAIRALRVADPMIAARDFAEAHHALTEVFNDPKARRDRIFDGIAAFRTSAAALADALKGAKVG